MASKKNRGSAQAALFTGEEARMPEGYYSGDQPNPNLRPFVEAHMKERPYDPTTDHYDVPPFVTSIHTTKVDAIYNLHPYDSKKSHLAISEYIGHYCRPGDIVLDPFCGSGSTLVAAGGQGCRSIGIDLSPLAVFITHEAVTPRSIVQLDEAFAQLTALVAVPMHELYRTTCDRCGGEAQNTGTVLSECFRCLRCLSICSYYSCLPADEDGSRLCPECAKRPVDSLITTSFKREGTEVVEVSYRCLNGCKPVRGKRSVRDAEKKAKAAFANDKPAILRVHGDRQDPNRVNKRMFNSTKDDERWALLWRPYLKGFNTIDDFFTPRNLSALLVLLDSITSLKDRALLLVLSSILAKCSHLMAQNSDGIGRVMKGTYYVGAVRREVNVWQFFCEAFVAVRDAKVAISEAIKAPGLVSCQNSTDLSNIPANSIDYVFTDPPYSGKVQFGELNFLREAFLGIGVEKLDDEIIINDYRSLSEDDWAQRMRRVSAELYRVLKPGRWLTLCYHDTSDGTWPLIQDIMAEAGFVSDDTDETLFIETRQKSIKQITAKNVSRRDLVINFRKLRCGELSPSMTITGDEDERTFKEKVHAIVIQYLSANPGSMKDRIYDEVVSRMVRAGQMQVHNFDELLSQVAEGVLVPVKKNLFEDRDPDLFGTHEETCWYLKQTQLEIVDEATRVQISLLTTFRTLKTLHIARP